MDRFLIAGSRGSGRGGLRGHTIVRRVSLPMHRWRRIDLVRVFRIPGAAIGGPT